jgi:hypothetical protein
MWEPAVFRNSTRRFFLASLPADEAPRTCKSMNADIVNHNLAPTQRDAVDQTFTLQWWFFSDWARGNFANYS